MPDWKQILDEINSIRAQCGQANASVYDTVRRRYLTRLSEFTGRNTIIYYSGWLQKAELRQHGFEFGITDADKNGFMTCIHEMDRSLGLDLILHTPGGEMAATESLVDYLRSMFGTDINAIVPQIAMSGGTMIACACKEIIMGKQSSIGPIDPQVNGLPAHGVIEEFDKALEQIKADPAAVAVWQPIIANYHPTLLGECRKAMEWSVRLAGQWLTDGMFRDEPHAEETVSRIVDGLTDHALNLSHSRHISMEAARQLGLTVRFMEESSELQDLILSVHHSCIHTLAGTVAIKIIENHEGAAFINHVQLAGPKKQ